MTLDTDTLRVAFALVALTLLVLFFTTFRRTRSTYSGWLGIAIILLLVGSLAYRLNGTDHQVWANPLGNVLLVAGATSIWAGARSLRSLRPAKWQLAVGPAVTAVASVLDSPASNIWSGGPVFLAAMFIAIGLASLEFWKLKQGYSQANRPIGAASGLLAVYYFARWIVFLIDGPDGMVFGTYFSAATTTLVALVLLVAVSFSMTALSNEQLIAKLNERATRDDLTGLFNRGAFLDLAADELRRLDLNGSAATLILADLDHFKAINDEYGHSAGDSALQAFAAACSDTVRSTDLVGRYGGEEFVILLPGASQDRAEGIAAEISRQLASAKTPDGVRFPTVSYGVTSSTFDAADLTLMIAAADAALYQAKSQGRNRVVRAAPPPEVEPAAGGWALRNQPDGG